MEPQAAPMQVAMAQKRPRQQRVHGRAVGGGRNQNNMLLQNTMYESPTPSRASKAQGSRSPRNRGQQMNVAQVQDPSYAERPPAPQSQHARNGQLIRSEQQMRQVPAQPLTDEVEAGVDDVPADAEPPRFYADTQSDLHAADRGRQRQQQQSVRERPSAARGAYQDQPRASSLVGGPDELIEEDLREASRPRRGYRGDGRGAVSRRSVHRQGHHDEPLQGSSFVGLDSSGGDDAWSSDEDQQQEEAMSPDYLPKVGSSFLDRSSAIVHNADATSGAHDHASDEAKQ